MPVTVSGAIYPTNAEFIRLQMDLLPRFRDGRLGLTLLPERNSDSAQIVLNAPDIFRGLQQYRGLGQSTRHIEGNYNYWGKMGVLEPGYWGEHKDIDEEVMTKYAQPGFGAVPMDLTEYMTRMTEWMMEREYNRKEFMIWQCLTYGRYEALNSQGQIVHQAQFNIQEMQSAIPWSNKASSTPLGDFRCVQLKGRGTSARFDVESAAYMNRVTANNLFANTNANDVGKAGLTAWAGSFMGPDVINTQFKAQGLPQIQIYDQGYIDDGGNFQPYIPDGKVIFVGVRPGGTPPGHFFHTRNALGATVGSGAWQKVIDTVEREVPRRIGLYRGFNGGPAIEYPRMIVVLDTGAVNAC